MIRLDVPSFHEGDTIARATGSVIANREFDEPDRRSRSGAREQDFQRLVSLR
jgi:hypothetical protein